MERGAGVEPEESGVTVLPEKAATPAAPVCGAGGLGTSPPSLGRGALRPGRTGTQRNGGGTDARSGMQAGRMAPSAVELPRARAERVSVGVSDQRERADEDGRER